MIKRKMNIDDIIFLRNNNHLMTPSEISSQTDLTKKQIVDFYNRYNVKSYKRDPQTHKVGRPKGSKNKNYWKIKVKESPRKSHLTQRIQDPQTLF